MQNRQKNEKILSFNEKKLNIGTHRAKFTLRDTTNQGKNTYTYSGMSNDNQTLIDLFAVPNIRTYAQRSY